MSDDAYLRSAERTIPFAPHEIFALLSDPSRHPDIDGSGTVRRVRASEMPLRPRLHLRHAHEAGLRLLHPQHGRRPRARPGDRLADPAPHPAAAVVHRRSDLALRARARSRAAPTSWRPGTCGRSATGRWCGPSRGIRWRTCRPRWSGSRGCSPASDSPSSRLLRGQRACVGQADPTHRCQLLVRGDGLGEDVQPAVHLAAAHHEPRDAVLGDQGVGLGSGRPAAAARPARSH